MKLIKLSIKLILFTIIHVVCYPLKFLIWIAHIIFFHNKKKTLIVLNDIRLGHIIYNIININNINENIDVIVNDKYFEFAKKTIVNNKVNLYSKKKYSFKIFWQNHITHLYFSPFGSSHFSFFSFFLVPWRIRFFFSNKIDSVQLISNMCLVRIFKIIPLMLSTHGITNTKYSFCEVPLDSKKHNVEKDFFKIYEKYFYLKKITQNKLITRNIQNIILINVQANETYRNLPLKSLVNILEKIKYKKTTKLIFIGVGNIENKINDYINKLKKMEFVKKNNIKIENKVNSTTLIQLIDLLNKSKFIISVETGVSHLAYMLNIPAYVYLVSKNIRSKHHILWWNTNEKKNYRILNKI